ncbi:hypothetical protein ACFS5L_32200 [Streptomyces phyllanthi]|uniref:Uncharacterized protein n=1 Tax=Streptomyces phyllanthi TaxID=1803180 RepID=A0A5N8WDV8_9ACTN|nr:hypothetical protein [Streptomyces phyllanthi]MPY45651.1 hypothetical protein [Streptomyces phyllanthi]
MADFERDSGWLSGSVVDAEDARLATGVLAAAASDPGNPVASRTGLKPGPGSPGNVEATSTPSRFVTVRPFQAVIQGTRTSAAGPYLATLAQQKTLDVLAAAPAHTSNPRLALVVAQQTDRQYGDPADGMVVRVVPGDPAVTPVRPTVTGDFLPLAEIKIAAGAGAITQADITDLRVSTVAAGGVLPLKPHESLPADGYGGQHVYDVKNELDMVRRGNSWRPAVTGQIQFFGPSDPGWPKPGSTEATAYVFNQVTIPPAPYPRMLLCTGQLTATAQTPAEARFDHFLRVVGESGSLAISAFGCTPTGIATTVATAHRLLPAGTQPLVITQQFARVAGAGTLTVHAAFSIPVYSGLRILAFPVP